MGLLIVFTGRKQLFNLHVAVVDQLHAALDL